MKITGYIILLSILTFQCGQDNDGLPFYNSPEFSPEWIGEGEEAFEKIHSIEDFSFLNQDGKIVSEQTVEDKIYVVDFFFTFCPGICPKLANNMFTLQETFKEDDQVLLLSHTVAPWKDSVEELRYYADKQGVISGKWHLLTGDKKEMYDLARKSYFADEDIGFERNENDFLHTENFILIDQKRRIRGIYNGTLPLEINQIIEDIKMLKKET